MSHKIVKEWKTEAGPKAVILFVHEANHCGYVEIPKGHPLFGKSYSDVIDKDLANKILEGAEIGKRGVVDLFCHDPENVQAGFLFDVHGGVTYSGGDQDYPAKSEDKIWWFGYDCAHCGDETRGPYSFTTAGDVFRDEAYCVGECERLANQIVDVGAVLAV